MSDRVADIKANLDKIMEPWSGTEAPKNVENDKIKTDLMTKVIETLKNTYKNVKGGVVIDGEHIDDSTSVISFYSRKFQIAYNITIFWGVFTDENFITPEVTITDFTVVGDDREANDVEMSSFSPYDSSSFQSRIDIALKDRILGTFDRNKVSFKKFLDGQDVTSDVTSVEPSGMGKPQLDDLIDIGDKVVQGSEYPESATQVVIQAIKDIYRVMIKAKKPITVGGKRIAKNQQTIVYSKDLESIPKEDYNRLSNISGHKAYEEGEPITKEMVLANIPRSTEDGRVAYSLITGMTPTVFQNLINSLED